MANMGTIMAQLGLDDSRFKAGVNNAGKWGKAKFAAIGGAMVGAFAAAFTVEKFKEAMNFAARIQEMSEATGLTTEEFQRLDYQMRQVGGTSQHLVIGMNTIDRAMAKAREGNEAFIKDFERLNITQKDFANPDRMHMMLKLFDAIRGMTAESRGGILDSLRRLVGDDAAKQFIKMFQEDFVGGLANAKVISEETIKNMKELTGELQNLNDQVLKELADILADNKNEIKEIIKFLGDAVSVTADLIKGLKFIFEGRFANPFIPSKYENVGMAEGAVQPIPERGINQTQEQYLKEMRDSLKYIQNNPEKYTMSAVIMG